MQKIRFFRAKFNDWMEIWNLEKRCFRPEDVFSPSRFRYLLNSPTCEIFVVRRNGKIIADIIGLFRNFRVPSGRIYKISVDTSERKSGIASALIKFMEERFKKAGLKKCFAEVRIGNQASKNLFLKNGYRQEKKLPRYYSDGEDGLKFCKEL